MTDKRQLEEILKRCQGTFAPVVPFNPEKEKIAAMDFSQDNEKLPAHALEQLPVFMQWVNEQLLQQKARYGIGGYGELRNVYSDSQVFDSRDPQQEPRRLHLGTDIWGKPLTPVMAPLDGLVHSFAFNNHFGDYGATILLTHHLEGITFYTLYGHLSLQSLTNLREGDRIRKGDVFAETGIPAENGQWPPHLHFQIIREVGDYQGDFPGVCRNSEKGYYLDLCPDPDLMLEMNRYLV